MLAQAQLDDSVLLSEPRSNRKEDIFFPEQSQEVLRELLSMIAGDAGGECLS